MTYNTELHILCSSKREFLSLIFGKPAAIVIPNEETSPETTAPVVRFFERRLDSLGMRLETHVIVPGVTRQGEVRDLCVRMATDPAG